MLPAALPGQWYDTGGVDAITDLAFTPVAVAVQQVAKQKSRTVMITASAISEFTSKLCSPTSSHWADDTHALTFGTADEMVKRGGKSWFFITVDFTFGRGLEAAAKTVIEENGGRVIGSSYFPINSTVFSAQLIQAQSSGAEIIGIAVGPDQVNAMKQAAEFGLTRGGKLKLAAFLVYTPASTRSAYQPHRGWFFPADFIGTRAIARASLQRRSRRPATACQPRTTPRSLQLRSIS